jgi:hypothetical protein
MRIPEDVRRAIDAIMGNGTVPKTSKYRNEPIYYEGVRYASKAEAARAAALDLEITAGVVRFWYPHPRFRLGVPENVYEADFLVVAAAGTVYCWAEDTKGVDTAKFKHDKILWRKYGKIPLRVIRRGRVAEVIEGGWDPTRRR